MSNAVHDRVTDWDTRIAKAVKTGKFTGDDKVRVSCWPTCGIGEKLQMRGLITLPSEIKTKVFEVYEDDAGHYEDETGLEFNDSIDDVICDLQGMLSRANVRTSWEYTDLEFSNKLSGEAVSLGRAFMDEVNGDGVKAAKATYAKIKALRVLLDTDNERE